MSGVGWRDAVAAANAAFYAAVEAGDLDALDAVLLDAPDSVCVHPGGPVVRGAGAVRRSWALVMAHTAYIQFFLTDVELAHPAETSAGAGGPSIVALTCTENVLSADEATATDAFAGGRSLATNVYRLTPDGWRLWIHHASPVLSASDHER